MEDKYLRHEVLPIDESARKRVRDFVNEYASRSEGHPFGNYGDEIVLQKYELSPVYSVHLQSQYDRRTVKDKQYPYKGGDIYVRKFYRPSDVDVWAYSLLTTEKFVHNGESFEVTGSHHVERCGRCDGSGKVSCPSCGGSGDQPCSTCSGKGQIKKTRQEYRHTADKVYSDGHREPVYNYVDVTYYEKCSNCHGSGRVNCYNCGGDGKVTCPVCEGYGKNVHCYEIEQKLGNKISSDYFFDANVEKVAELVDTVKLYDKWVVKKADFMNVDCADFFGSKLLSLRQKSIAGASFTEESELASALDSFIGEHKEMTGSTCHMLFQLAEIYRTDVWWVQYTYNGRTYDGCIAAGKDGKERFYAGVSPITELADKWLREAKKKVGGVGTIKARDLLEKVEKLHVYGRNTQQLGIQDKVNTHLNTLYNLGNDLMFWLIALLGTPFLYNFYSELNPVMRYVHFVNDPAWAPYGWVPAVQCILFLGLLWGAKWIVNINDHSKARHRTVFGFVFTGMGLYLLIAVGLLAVLLGLNYLGLSVITSGIFWLIWRIILIMLMIAVYICLIAYALIKWIWGLLVKLWHFIF